MKYHTEELGLEWWKYGGREQRQGGKNYDKYKITQ